MRIEIYDSEKLNFVELNITGDNENYNKLDENSFYLNTEVFNLFSNCYENAEPLFEYFGPTKYNSRKIVPLRNELLKSLDKLDAVKSKDDFVEYIGNIFLGKEFIFQLEIMDSSWANNWQSYIIKLKEVNKGMLGIVDKCIETEKILWVIGY